MTHAQYRIVGRKATGLYDRLSIEDLQAKEPRQFSLFILAYLALQGRDDESSGLLPANVTIPEAASFYHLAAIHGLPFEEWIGDKRNVDENSTDFNPADGKDTGAVPSRFGGYCNHGSVVFPTWHRPYVMAIEQSLGDIVEGIAKQMKEDESNDDELWMNAARAFRFPFWDWADEKVEKEGLPPVLYEEKVKILLPGGVYKEVSNPLSYYVFTVIPDGFKNEPNFQPGATAYFAEWTRTFRHAESSPQARKSRIDELNKQLKEYAKQIRCKVAMLFTFDDGCVPSLAWDEFSNHTTQSLRQMDFRNTDSLEGIHDQIHDILGGNGHMADPDYAGFDPIFFLHHCNVDRILALWEYVYPQFNIGNGYPSPNNDGRIYPFTQSRGTYNAVYNSLLDQSTALAPFRMENGKYWTSSAARHLDSLAKVQKYYSYPEVAGVKVDKSIPLSKRIALRSKLREYYGLKLKASAPREHTPLANLPLYQIPNESVPEGYSLVQDFRHFVAVVQTNEFAFNGPYTVKLNYTKPGRPEKEIFIGAVSVFARPDHSACQGCIMRRDAGSTIRGVIPISSEIIMDALSDVTGALLSEEDVLAQFKDHLRGVIVNKSGAPVGVAQGGPAGLTRDGMTHDDALDKFAVPDITLVSAGAARKLDGDFKWIDWQNHGKVFLGGHHQWTKVSAAHAQ